MVMDYLFPWRYDPPLCLCVVLVNRETLLSLSLPFYALPLVMAIETIFMGRDRDSVSKSFSDDSIVLPSSTIYRLFLKSLTISLTTLYSRVMSFNQLNENLRQMKGCRCAIPCSYGTIQSVKTYKDQDYVIRFLKGLNEQYAPIRSQIMLINSLLTTGKVFSMRMQQDRQFNSSMSSTLELKPQIHSINSNQKQ
ncbi:hypothetical protein Lal_00015799 [Lupinus albus]|nr:hypothetical protein Lal_00015799 [Lupinus albus]